MSKEKKSKAPEICPLSLTKGSGPHFVLSGVV